MNIWETESIKQLVTKTAKRTGRTSARGETQRKPETDSKDREFIKGLFEQYRNEPKESPNRKTVDRLVKLHRDFKSKDPFYIKRHNLIVLYYIIAEPMDIKTIRKRLGIKHKETFYNQLNKGLEEMAVYYFGYPLQC